MRVWPQTRLIFTTTPTMQLSRLYNKRVQNEADGEPGEFRIGRQRYPGSEVV